MKTITLAITAVLAALHLKRPITLDLESALSHSNLGSGWLGRSCRQERKNRRPRAHLELRLSDYGGPSALRATR